MNTRYLSLLALAMLAGAAQAQSSVNLYGRVDLNLTRYSGGVGWRMDQSSTSRFGLRGSEDLGGGTNAYFQLESRINPQNGTNEANRFWGREAWVGLRGGFGALRLGRSLAPSQRVASNYDPHGTDGIGSMGSTTLLIGLSQLVRLESAAYYETPKFGGFSVFAAAQMDDQANALDDRIKTVRLRYESGPIDVSLAHADLRTGNEVTSFGAAFKLGAFTPMAQYHTGERNGAKRKTMLVGTLMKLGPGEVRAAWSKFDDRTAANLDRTLAAAGYDYSLSKRTLVYGTVVRDKVRTLSGNTGIEMGMRHSF
jgi:predicted porin